MGPIPAGGHRGSCLEYYPSLYRWPSHRVTWSHPVTGWLTDERRRWHGADCRPSHRSGQTSLNPSFFSPSGMSGGPLLTSRTDLAVLSA